VVSVFGEIAGLSISEVFAGVLGRGLIGFGIDGPPVVNDKGWSEQTRRVSTPALRNRAQNSCAPTSLEPLSSFAAFLKSACS
jgi:hypothetical protein